MQYFAPGCYAKLFGQFNLLYYVCRYAVNRRTPFILLPDTRNIHINPPTPSVAAGIRCGYKTQVFPFYAAKHFRKAE